MKKKIKIILIAITSFIVLYGVIFLTDMSRVKQLKKPIFCIENGYMGSMTRFDGLGYKIGLDINATTGEITYGQMTMLGQYVVKLYADYFDVKEPSNTSEKIEVIKPEVSNLNKFNKYLERDNRTIYLAGNVEEVYYTDSEIKMTLKDYISKSYQTLDDSIKHLTDIIDYVDTLKDGGTMIYKSNAYDITIIKCNTVEGNKDIFIGDYSMNFDSKSMCK
jgi:hypothetical protein